MASHYPGSEIAEQRFARRAGDVGDAQREVVVEVATDLAVGVADARGKDAAGGEQQPRRLHRARGHDELAGGEANGAAGAVAGDEGVDAPARG